MKSLFSIISLFLFSSSILAQPSWNFFSADSWVQDIKVIDDFVYIGNPAGFHVFNIKTKKHKLFQSSNSDLRGSFVWEMLTKDDHVWIALNEGGLAKYNIEDDAFSGEWEQYYTPVLGDTDTLHRARNLIEDDEGTLWFDAAWDGRGFLMSLKDGVLSDHSDIFTEQPGLFSCHGSKRIYYRDSQSPLNYIDLQSLETVQVSLPDGFSEVGSYTSFYDDLFVSFSAGVANYIYIYDDWK